MSFIACDKKHEEPVDSWYYEKTEMKTDVNYIAKGKFSFLHPFGKRPNTKDTTN